MKVVCIIPARYGSTRLPGKPLKDINGRPMIWWVYHRIHAIQNINEIYVATDHPDIVAVCKNYGIPVVLTRDDHPTGANRLQEVSEHIAADFYVQVNGDEPLIDTKAVSAAIPSRIPQDIEFGTNVITEIRDAAHLMDPSNIKVVFDSKMNALYMSRMPIPYPFKDTNFKYYKHVGVIGYNKRMLDFYKNSIPGRLELIEGIDTLRFLDYGKKLLLIKIPKYNSLSVDTSSDLEEVRRRIKSEK